MANSAAEEMTQELEDSQPKTDENQEIAEVVAINTGRLLKIRHNLSKIQKLKTLSDELTEYKEACTEIKTLIGELNGITGGQKGK